MLSKLGLHDETGLSPSGAARRERMLLGLKGELRTRRRQRVVFRACAGGFGACVLALVGVAGARALSAGAAYSPSVSMPHVIAGARPIAPVPVESVREERTLVEVGIVRDDPTVIARWSVVAARLPESVTDGQLLAALAESGEDCGLMRMGERAEVVWNTP